MATKPPARSCVTKLVFRTASPPTAMAAGESPPSSGYGIMGSIICWEALSNKRGGTAQRLLLASRSTVISWSYSPPSTTPSSPQDQDRKEE